MSDPKELETLRSQGYFLKPVRFEPLIRNSIHSAVGSRNWIELDRLIRIETQTGGAVFDTLSAYEKFSEIEFIISIRSSLLEPDEDGIWHDDGSRVLAFSLSLTENPQTVVGGRLEIRKRDPKKILEQETVSATDDLSRPAISTPEFGTMIVFGTGVSAFEHKINRVDGGERIIIAGWCT